MDLLKAYRATRYRVWLDPTHSVDLRIGTRCASLDEFLHSANTTEASFLTACNPHSQALSEAENAARMDDLRNRLIAEGFALLPGLGVPADSHWIAEDSILALDMSESAARRWAEHFEQLAFVHHQRDKASELILTTLYQQQAQPPEP